jgi:polysaccharide biosynthesis/export protein
MKLLYLALISLILSSSCVRYRDLVNFREAVPPLEMSQALPHDNELRIQANDLLQITISAGESEAGKMAAAPFNMNSMNQQQGMFLGGGQQQQQFGANQTNYQLELLQGYLVNTEGAVTIPNLGEIYLGGKTLLEAQRHILTLLEPFIENPGVDIRFLNLKITLFGEIARPGLMRLSNQRITILEALSAAGDLTPFANRRAILLIREHEGKREYHRLDLSKGDLFQSPAFYLRQNDLIYVEPLPIKIAATPDLISRIIGYTTAGLSVVTLIIALGK